MVRSLPPARRAFPFRPFHRLDRFRHSARGEEIPQFTLDAQRDRHADQPLERALAAPFEQFQRGHRSRPPTDFAMIFGFR
jgi:hypothetical protein